MVLLADAQLLLPPVDAGVLLPPDDAGVLLPDAGVTGVASSRRFRCFVPGVIGINSVRY